MLMLSDYVRSAAQMLYLLNCRHAPYDKWLLRGVDTLPRLAELRPALEFLLTAENDESGRATKAGVIEDVCAAVVRELSAQGLTDGNWDYLENHAFSLMDHIQNPEIRALHVMGG